MWPGASPAWRKRQPTIKPRLGINLNPPKASRSSLSTSQTSTASSIFAVIDPILLTRRQLDDGLGGEAGTDEVGPAPVAPAAPTYNNGLWTPTAAGSAASATPPGFTATVALASDSSSEEDATMSTTAVMPSSTASLSATLASTSASASRTATHTSLSSGSSSSSTSTSSSSASPSTTDKSHSNSNSGSGGFKLVYLTPILVFVGLFLIFSVGGRMWGRYHHASRVEAARRAKYDKHASRQAKKREMQRIKTMWGYDRTPMLPAELEPGEHDLHYKNPHTAAAKPKTAAVAATDADAESSFGSDSESGKSSELDERYPGTFKILSLALLGEGSKPEPPETRGEGGRKYDVGVQSNGWLAVKIRRWIGNDEEDLSDTRYTMGPNKAGGRRMRHALSRDRLRASATAQDDEKSTSSLASPTSTLSVGSGEMKYKAEFSSVDLSRPNAPYSTSPNRYAALGHVGTGREADDPFLTTASQEATALGWRKPLPPQPKESPFRPAILNFGLRSRSKQYDSVAPQSADQLDTPVKATPLQNYNADESAAAGFLPKTLGLGISGVWKTITNLTHPTSAAVPLQTDDDDEESFIGRPYRPHSDVMSDSDTPYSAHRQQAYGDAGTPTKQSHLARTGTVLHVKTTANQPWNTQHSASPAKKISAAAWNDALLASPVNKPALPYQPMQIPQQPSPSPSPTKKYALAPRKSLLLHQAVTSASAAAESKLANAISPAFTDYSELVACYSTPSDVQGEGSIRVLSPPPAVSDQRREYVAGVGTGESVGARQKLQRAKTTKMSTQHDEARRDESVQRSKTSSTSASGSGLNRKATVHHSVRSTKPSNVDTRASPDGKSGLYQYTLTQPLRVSKPPSASTSDSPAIPTRASSSSPTKPSPSTFPHTTAATHLPTALRIASPEPLHPHLQSLPLLRHQPHHPHYQPEPSASPPKRAKAVSNRSNPDEEAAARNSAAKAFNRNTAFQTVDEIVFNSYAQHR
ncbi:hypothetical protein EX895_001319 [Sporisorium graminicola]|uniref:Uncharacterized protein n=1 Tax=Sporisorium graminicola TaxID=280036 RepID=A0A4U7KXJ0_9BASI|nr:hypothetical protein EX895_001319 [Sporisorium graminicola]TKY89534.1 hypothetical protein EX895_001319 [Sporisorium graminicola]